MMPSVRTTLRIDEDLLAELKRLARAQKLSLTQLANRLLRRGIEATRASGAARPAYRETTFAMGRPRFELDKALALAAAIEDEETVAELARRK
jgi:hypothetical protein